MKFFAVTETSVYSVSDERDEKGVPIVEKIALRGESKVAIGQRLSGGQYVGVTPEGIIFYDQDHLRNPPQKPEYVNIAFYGGHTSLIVALFLDKEEAMKCHNSKDHKPSDSRWEDKTKEVLNAIGDNHLIFIVSYWSPDLSKFHFPR